MDSQNNDFLAGLNEIDFESEEFQPVDFIQEMTNAEQPNETSLNAMILELEMPKNSTVEPQMEPQMEPQAGPSSINLVPEPQIAEPQATGHHFVEVPRSNRTVDQFRFPLRHSYLKADGVTKGFLTHNDPRAMCVDYELGFNSPCMSTRCWFYNSHFWSIHKDLMETIKVRFEGGDSNFDLSESDSEVFNTFSSEDGALFGDFSDSGLKIVELPPLMKNKGEKQKKFNLDLFHQI
ncbi:unnamed protein product [Allacma fusca]|uniref:Uncharacterized protein n=1 Tax=Allacma fusca TaxID=39272 RepID=A0A8J2KGK5_9HEXA|nr:unnamed protein product [Allacma fusca]